MSEASVPTMSACLSVYLCVNRTTHNWSKHVVMVVEIKYVPRNNSLISHTFKGQDLHMLYM